MYRLIFSIIIIMFAASVSAKHLEITEHKDKETPKRFNIELPMACVTEGYVLLENLGKEGFELVFMGKTQALGGGGLLITVFLHPIDEDFYTILTNLDSEGSCIVLYGKEGSKLKGSN